MGRVLVIGEAARVRPFALAGAVVAAADSAEAAVRAWTARPGDVTLVILTPRAAEALSGLPRPAEILEAVMEG